MSGSKIFRPPQDVKSGLDSRSPVFDQLLQSAEPKLCWSGGEWLEGPAYIARLNLLVFSDIPNNRILGYDLATGDCRAWREPSHYANGNTVGPDGTLFTCEQGSRSLTATTPAGDWNTLVSTYNGKKLNSPNDVVRKKDGSIWFTDPPYGIIDPTQGYELSESQIGANYLFRYDPKTTTLKAAGTTLDRPNGLAFSPNEDRLYVSDTGAEPQVFVFDIAADGETLQNQRIFITPSPGKADGIRVDSRGYVYIALWDGVHIYSDTAQLLGKILVPQQRTANCAFAGADDRYLFITATSCLYSVELAPPKS